MMEANKGQNENNELYTSSFIKRLIRGFIRNSRVTHLSRKYPYLNEDVIEIIVDEDPNAKFEDQYGKLMVEQAKIKRERLYGTEQEVYYEWDYFDNLIEANEGIPYEDKIIFREYKIVFDKYSRLLNHYVISERLKKLRVKQSNESQKEDTTTVIDATFKDLENIMIYNGNPTKATRCHEVGHVFQESYENYAFEYANEIMSREVERTYQNLREIIEGIDQVGYNGEDSIYYVLMDLIDIETRVRFWARGRRAILEDKLIEFDEKDSLEQGNAYKLMTMLNEMRIGNLSVNMDCYYQSLCILNNYYKKIKGEDLTENLVLFLLLNSDYIGKLILSRTPKYNEKIQIAYKILLGENNNGTNIKKTAVIPHSYYEINENPDIFVCWYDEKNIKAVKITQEQMDRYKEQVKGLNRSESEQIDR